MTRIIAGAHGGRRLVVPAGSGTRPTSDRVREAIFNTLRQFGDLAGAHVLDLYAGTGALGLEALSRGAESLVAVDSGRQAVHAIRANVASLGVAAQCTVLQRKVSAVLAEPALRSFDVVFADPPYADAARETALLLERLQHGWLTAEGIVVLETAVLETAGPLASGNPGGWATLRERSYGGTHVWYGELSGEPAVEPDVELGEEPS